MEKSKFQQVKEFNDEIINLEIKTEAKDLPEKRSFWFYNVIDEELAEFAKAHQLKDNVGMLDALIDMAYFILGRVYECGFTEAQWDKCFAAVHEANMTKRKGNKGRGSDDDAVKDSDWVGPEARIKEILTDSKPTTKTMCELEPSPMCELEPSPVALEAVEHRKPSVYLEDDGCQRIFSIDELNLFAKMSPVFKEVTNIAIKKSQDYNNGNGQPTSRANYFPFGLLSYAQMLHTKSQRLNSLAQQDKTPNNESVRDTLLDMINYATFAVEAIDKGEI